MTNYLIVLNKYENTVSFIDEVAGEVVKIVEVGQNSHEVAATADGGKAFVSNVGGNTITVFDMKTLEITATIEHPEFNFPHEG